MKTKICYRCRQEKSLSEFHKDISSKDGIDNLCKECSSIKGRDYLLKKKYNITFSEKEDMINHQNNKCAICNKLFLDILDCCVDHSHKTGKIRGILCRSCNRGIGYLKDNPAVCDMASIYLRGIKCTEEEEKKP
jgi:hypothetical protein